jgi:hypothetical protein
MTADLYPLQVLLVTLAGWVNRHQHHVIEYLVEENRAFGTYLTSSGSPDGPEPFVTEFLFSPRIGACDRADIGAVASHDPRGVMFVLPKDPDHGEWRLCLECATLFKEGGDNGRCFGTDGGPHVPIGDRVTLPVGVPEDEQNQSAWRRCGRCQNAYWDGNRVNKGHCPAGGPHAPTDPVLTLPHRSFRDDGAWQHPPTEPLRRRWRFCAKCAGLFWEGDFRQLRGICPKAGEHDPWGHDFLLTFARGAPRPGAAPASPTARRRRSRSGTGSRSGSTRRASGACGATPSWPPSWRGSPSGTRTRPPPTPTSRSRPSSGRMGCRGDGERGKGVQCRGFTSLGTRLRRSNETPCPAL